MIHIFIMELISKGQLEHIHEPEYLIPDLELEDSLVILMSICEALQNSPSVSFVVSGFGQDQWPVDCRTDLCTVMEQVPELLQQIRADFYPFELDFYEQGIESRLLFEENMNLVKITCSSRTEWVPKPRVIVTTKAEVSNKFEALYCTFINLSNIICKELVNHPSLEDWKV